jgi:coproporphyrinogen III oxidase-like Fe-S oxidoreductase
MLQPAEEEAAAVEEKSVEEQKAEDRPADKVRTLLLALLLCSALCQFCNCTMVTVLWL